tara:strand:+ start:350 stop:514 length:165 start_codon:yes stop_codon:yes gene_type:complete
MTDTLQKPILNESFIGENHVTHSENIDWYCWLPRPEHRRELYISNASRLQKGAM